MCLNLEEFVRFGLNMLLQVSHTTAITADKKPDITSFAFILYTSHRKRKYSEFQILLKFIFYIAYEIRVFEKTVKMQLEVVVPD